MDTEMAGTRGDASGERAAKTQANSRKARLACTFEGVALSQERMKTRENQ
jgi:hypothetical protein